LIVAEAISIDVGRGIARIDPEAAEKLKISKGDAIEILGKRHTFALCWEAHPRDAGKGLIRIDNYTRENASVSIDDKVRIRKISAKYAQGVKLAPHEQLRIVGGEEYVRNILSGVRAPMSYSCRCKITRKTVVAGRGKISDFLATGRATVISDVGDAAEFVKRHDAGVVTVDVSDSADKIASLLSNAGLREEMGRSGPERSGGICCLYKGSERLG
jgi:transitional endoplasmic reticulum ATPase